MMPRFKIFNLFLINNNRIKLIHLLVPGIILSAILNRNFAQSLSISTQTQENSLPIVLSSNDELPPLSDPDIQKGLAQSFLKCSTQCSNLPDCLGVTIYKLAPSETRFSSSHHNFVCKATLSDEINTDENSEFPKLSTVFYKIMFRDKLPKVQRRNFAMRNSRFLLDGENENFIFINSEKKRKKRDTSPEFPHDENIQPTPQIPNSDSTPVSVPVTTGPEEPSVSQQGNDASVNLGSSGNISEVEATSSITVKPSVILPPKEMQDASQAGNIQINVNPLFENETTTNSIYSSLPETTPLEKNNAILNTTDKMEEINDNHEAAIIKDSSLPDTTTNSSENNIVIILPSPEENFSEDLFSSSNDTENNTEAMVEILASPDHVFLSNDSNNQPILTSVSSDGTPLLVPTENDILPNNSPSESATVKNSIILDFTDGIFNDAEKSTSVTTERVTESSAIILSSDNDIFKDDSHTLTTESVTEKNGVNFSTEKMLFSDSGTADSVTENSAVILPSENSNIFSSTNSTHLPAETVTEKILVNFSPEDNLFSESSTASSEDGASKNNSVIFAPTDNIFENSISSPATLHTATEDSTVSGIPKDNLSSGENKSQDAISVTVNNSIHFSTESNIFNENASHSTTESVTEKNKIILGSTENIFNENVFHSSTESVTEKNKIILGSTENIFNENVFHSSTESVTEKNKIILGSTENIFNENASHSSTESVTEKNTIILGSTENVFNENPSHSSTESVTEKNTVILGSTENIINHDITSSVATESVTEKNAIIFSTESSIFNGNISSPISSTTEESVTVSNKVVLGPSEDIFDNSHSTPAPNENPIVDNSLFATTEKIFCGSISKLPSPTENSLCQPGSITTSTEKPFPAFGLSDENISAGIIPDSNPWEDHTEKTLEDLKLLPKNISYNLTTDDNSKLVQYSTTNKTIVLQIPPTLAPSTILNSNEKIKVKANDKVGNSNLKEKNKKKSQLFRLKLAAHINVKTRGNETIITHSFPPNVTIVLNNKNKIVKANIPERLSTTTTVKPIDFSNSESGTSVKETNIDESSAVTTAADLGCTFQDSERYIRNIKSSVFSMLGGEETMLTFVSGVQSHCVATLTREGKQGLRSIENILTGFPLDLEVEAAGFVNDHIYVVDSSGQNVWDFQLNETTNLYTNVPMDIKPYESTKDKFLEICQIETHDDIEIKSFIQIHDTSCIIFDESRIPIVSKNANIDSRDLAKAIAYLLEIEFINYVESSFAWQNESLVSSVYVYGSNGELYRLYRNASTDFKWKNGKYELLEYSVLPLKN